MDDEQMKDIAPETPDDGDVTQELEEAMQQLHPEENTDVDPFATDGLGGEPAETHESWND